MTVRFTRHAVARLRERFAQRDDLQHLLQIVERHFEREECRSNTTHHRKVWDRVGSRTFCAVIKRDRNELRLITAWIS